MSETKIACIVEGHGDVKAVHVVIRRIVQELDPTLRLTIPHPPIRVPRRSIVKAGELERAVELAANKTTSPGAVLVVLDADEDCPATLGPALLERARVARGDMQIAVVLANPEFETWFLASAESLRGRQGLSPGLTAPADPEKVRGAKEWLRSHMTPNRRYAETID